jgi:hypothetical protein
MGDSIRLSEKHGLNTALGRCFWCGGDDGTILLLGRLPDDAKAPRKIVSSYEPCATCRAGMALGVTVLEVETKPRGTYTEPRSKIGSVRDTLPPMFTTETTEFYPTGRFMVIKMEAALRIFGPEMHEAVQQTKKAMMSKADFEIVFASQLGTPTEDPDGASG